MVRTSTIVNLMTMQVPSRSRPKFAVVRQSGVINVLTLDTPAKAGCSSVGDWARAAIADASTTATSHKQLTGHRYRRQTQSIAHVLPIRTDTGI